MKNTLRLSIIAIAAIATFGSCTPGPSSSSYHVTGSASSMGSFSSTGSSVTNSGATGAKINITGVSSSGAKFMIILNPYTGSTGTFPLSDTTDTFCQYTPTSGGTINMSVHGTVTLTSVSPNLVGTFVFTGRDSSIFTGSFNAPPPSM